MSNVVPAGWKPWKYLDGVNQGLMFLDASLPKDYFPSSKFWMYSDISHCLIPWLTTVDLFNAFLLSGGNAPSLVGSVGGLSVVNELMPIANKIQTFGIGEGAPAPSLGYCIGDKFQQQVYTTMTVMNTSIQGEAVVTDYGIELLQNYRFKRIYINHGSVQKYNLQELNGVIEYSLTLDLGEVNAPTQNITNETMHIILAGNSNSSSQTIDVNILGVKNNWDFIISRPPIDIPEGSYYKLDSVMCVEDPYLLGGFWNGNENEIANPPASSGLGLYITSHNSPYQKGKFLGTYIWKTNPSALEISNGASSVVSQQPISGFSMDDSAGSTWAFNGLGNGPTVPYSNDKRYNESNDYRERLSATSSDYGELINSSPEYLRVEIEKGGYTYRRNWYAPCLKGQYININNKMFRILNHITYNIIDISFLSVDGVSTLDPSTNQEYSIINQYAWFITEHYNRKRSDKGNYGIFNGIVKSISDDSLEFTVSTDGDEYVDTVKKGARNNLLSFVDRYRNEISLYSSLKKQFKKYNGWKFVIKNGPEYDIESIDFSTAATSNNIPYDIIVKLKYANTKIAIGDSIYVSFGETFNVVGNYSKSSGYHFDATFKTADKNASGFIVSDYLCIDGKYSSVPYKIDVSGDDRFGFCDGYWFGYEMDGTAASLYGQASYITVTGANIGTSALYHNLSQEDWVAYEDAVTKKITIRKGLANFTDYPKKEMISYGNSFSVTYSSNPVSLDSSYDMVRSVEIKYNSNRNRDMAVLFGIGDVKNTYGFYISGLGILNLQLFSSQGIAYGSLPSDFYSGFGKTVSPVYLYSPSYFNNVSKNSIDIGTSTSNRQIYLINNSASMISNIDSVSIEYVNDYQTLSEIGYYDIIMANSGDIIFVYGSNKEKFNLIDENGNSILNNSEPYNSGSVMLLSACNNRWRSPFTDGDEYNQYPLMVLNGVDYLCCVYNKFMNSISFFIKCYYSEKFYLGCYTIPFYNLNYKKYKCYAINSSDKFLYRSPIVKDSFINDQSISWLANSDIIQDGYSLNLSIENILSDDFVRIMGDPVTNSQIDNSEDFGIISSVILKNGIYVIFYDTEIGVKMIYSDNCGKKWRKSNIIFYKNAKNPLFIDMYLIAITSEGIEIQKNDLSDFYRAISIGLMAEGNDRTNKEIELQAVIDGRSRILIGSGLVESQRLSGYITPAGIIRVFFYNQDGLLVCIESYNSGNKWNYTNNF